MKINKQGWSRTVVLLGNYAFKFPSLRGHYPFLYGCYANWSERRLWKISCIYGYDLKEYLAPSLFCSWFGLIQIQKRCAPKLEHLTQQEIEYFKGITSDIKRENFGYFKNKLVCVDYP